MADFWLIGYNLHTRYRTGFNFPFMHAGRHISILNHINMLYISGMGYGQTYL